MYLISPISTELLFEKDLVSYNFVPVEPSLCDYSQALLVQCVLVIYNSITNYPKT